MLIADRRKVSHPDVPCVLAQIEHDLVAGNRDIRRAQVKVSPRQSSTVEVLDGQRHANRPFRRRVETLRPQARRAVAIRPEVKEIRLR